MRLVDNKAAEVVDNRRRKEKRKEGRHDVDKARYSDREREGQKKRVWAKWDVHCTVQ